MENLVATEHMIDAEYKDNSPMQTVNKIKSILAEYGIETEEKWRQTNVPYCYAISVVEKETGFSVNGKGLTPEFTLASGYGEFMERLQLGFVGKRAVQKDGAYAINDEKPVKVSAKELFSKNRDWYEKMALRLQAWNGSVIAPEEIVTQYSDANGDVEATPFVNLLNGQTEYLPAEMRKNMYTSSGCAAGNSIEEALVQALGEIVERYYRLQIISQKICAPEVPEEVLKQYKIAYSIISHIRQCGYKVIVKDCSLGTKFPVVCVCYIDTKSGKYHTHFGAYPIFEIALERALTETFQGREIGSFADHDEFFLAADDKAFVANMAKELVYGTSSRMPEFFVGRQDFAYNENVGFQGKNNKELLKECIEFFREQGYDVLARNASSLGFPTCQVIVPGYSETYINRISKKTDENRYLPFSVKTFRNPQKADLTDMMAAIMHMNEVQSVYLHYKQRTSFLAGTKLLVDLNSQEENFLLLSTMAYIYYALGNMANVAKNVKQMLKLNLVEKEEYLICLYRYLTMRINKYDVAHIKSTLEFLHTELTVKRLYAYLDNGKNPLDPFVLHCDMQCDESCILKNCCHQEKAQKLIETVNNAAQKLSFDAFSKAVNDLIRN